MKVNPADLHIETDDAGFILGQSLLGDQLGSEATVWLERSGEIHSVSMSRAVEVSAGVQFSPANATLTVVMAHDSLKDGAFGKRIRLRYKDSVEFTGEVKIVDVNYSIQNNKAKTAVRIQAIGIVERFNRLVLNDLQRPEETAGIRAASLIVSSDVVIEANNCNRLMAARGQSTVKLMTVLKETANTQLARFYVDKRNVLILDGDPSPEPVIFFSDDPAVEGRTDYRSVAMKQDVENTITAASVVTKQSMKVTDTAGQEQDVQLTAVVRHPSAVVTHEELYEVDVPLRQNEVDAWAQSFPLLGFTRMEPAQLVCAWQDELDALELTEIVSIQKDGQTYRAGVKAIRYDIVANQDGMTWTVSLELLPGHLVEYTPVIAPSDPKRFKAVAVNDHRIDLSWSAPALRNSFTGYELRYAQGPKPPATRTQGTLLATVNDDIVSYSHTGISSATRYSYSIWAVTTNPAVSSNAVTTGAATPETIPSAVRSVTAAKTSTAVHKLTWLPPVSPGTDIDHYMIRGSNQPPSATGDYWFADVPYGTNTWTSTNGQLGLNQVVHWGVWAVTRGGAVSEVARVSQNTNETVPSGVGNLSVIAPAYNSVNVSWTPSANVTDLNHYRVAWFINGGRAPGANEGYQIGTSGTSVGLTQVQMNSWHDVSVFPITNGGLVGPRVSGAVLTPQGIFSKVYDGGVAWTQSYRENGAPSSLGSGNAQNLYYGYGDSFNGNQRSLAGWNLPGDIVNCYSIDRVIMRIYNLHAYNNSGADCWFGVHGYTGPPGTWGGGATSLATYRMPKPGWVEIDVTAWAAPHFRNGGRGFFLGPPPSNSSAYYGYAAGTPGPAPSLRIEYRTLGG
jgi:hypothetical protein